MKRKIKKVTIHNDVDRYDRIIIYDEHGHEIYNRDSFGFETWYDYDDRGNMTHMKDSYENEEWLKYDDENGFIIHRKVADVLDASYTCDENGPPIKIEYSDGSVDVCSYDYDTNKRVTHMRCVYDDGGQHEEWYDYDDHGNMIHTRDSDGYETWSTYDENNLLIQVRDKYDHIDHYEYEFYDE